MIKPNYIIDLYTRLICWLFHQDLVELENQKIALTYLEQDATRFNTNEVKLLSTFYSENKLKAHHLLVNLLLDHIIYIYK